MCLCWCTSSPLFKIRFNLLCLSLCVCSTPQATWRPWPTNQRRRLVLDPVGAAAVSTIPGGGGHGGNARLRRKRRTMTRRRTTTSIQWPMWKRSLHKVMECRRQQEIVVGAFRSSKQVRQGIVRRGQVRPV